MTLKTSFAIKHDAIVNCRSLSLLFRGYTAPEYAVRGELSEKTDIYSFGVLVLEIIGCRKNTDLSLPRKCNISQNM